MAAALFGWGAAPEPDPPPPPPLVEPVKLNLIVGPAYDTQAELANLRAQIRALEQRVSREAQTWAEQRAELLKEITAKDQALWAMMEERGGAGSSSTAAAAASGGSAQ